MTDQHPRGPGPARGGGAGPTAAAPPPQAAGTGRVPEAGRLRRERGQKVLGGVCGGLGRHYDMDPVIFRIVLAVLSVTGGLGLVCYGFAWLFVPLDGEEENQARRLLSGRVDGPALTAVLCALVGTGLFLSMMKNSSVFTFAIALGVLLAATGYWSRHRAAEESPAPFEAPSQEKTATTTSVYGGAPPEAQKPPVPGRIPSWWREPIVKDGTHIGGTGYLWGPEGLDDPASVPGALRSAYPPHRGAPPPAPKPREPRWIGGWLFLLTLLAGGLGTGLTWQHLNLSGTLQTGLAASLAVLGLGIAVSSRWGRTGGGSLLLAVLTAGLLAGAAALPPEVTTDWSRKDWRPANAAAVRPEYRLGTGDARLDLRGVRLTGNRTVTTRAEVGAGRLRVIVPPGATVRLHATTGVGDIQLPGQDQRDVDIAPGKQEDFVLRPTAGTPDRGTLALDLHVALGQVEVSRAS
ncbi:hypothetical protein SLNWT_4673 [Streptomyces albus]|uniref:Phage shock protein PspC N-terminal domain-containing protein n=1 Tax=Streptomyces albus (strain ATCC 21838 / DSM 41398 / FERM P-419 / JCM 4703 / NBRC 107858) TaxID=1081613 RepID=A0A0B5ETN9_STRA4|nr:hypothetical protein SLNWT_4673 [Streptomyces albus]AOU79356.1 hypothetical protein SLNHY_4665 [Streptomyces albus]AYN35082.1 PspC domain-containing protein [Streptomyces albus]